MKLWISHDDFLQQCVGVFNTKEETEESSWDYLESLVGGQNSIDKELSLVDYSISVFEGELQNG